MNKLTISFLLIIVFIASSCSDDKSGYAPFSLKTSYEVMLGDTLDISIVNGSGDLDIYNSDDGNFVEVDYEKGGTSSSYGRISVIGQKIGTSTFTVTDKVTNEKCTVSVKVVTPYLVLFFQGYPEEWNTLYGMGNMEFRLVANESKTCEAYRRFIDGAYQFETTMVMTGSYNISEDGTILSLDLKGDNLEFVRTFEIKKGDTSLLQKMPDIEKESQHFEDLVMSTSDTDEAIVAVIAYK